MSQVHALSALAGLVVVAGALAGLMSWQSGADAAARGAAEARGEWRPPCAARLGADYAALEPVAREAEEPPRTLIFGVDRSPSNLAIAVHRRLTWFTAPAQALHVLPIFVAMHLVAMLVRLATGDGFPGWLLLAAPLGEALLWPLVSVLLLAPQRRAPDRDANRPL